MRLFPATFRNVFAILLIILLQSAVVAGPAASSEPSGPAAAQNDVHNSTSQESFLTNVSPEEARLLITSATAEDELIILDIRTTPEFLVGHIANARHMNFYDNDFSEQLNALPKDKRYLIYCHSGSRSERALATMRKLGFQRIYHLRSGIAGWYKAGLPLER
ncbi:MAG: rhodanese-like domain-containing protein [Halodesulfovibrio sp.]